MTFTGVARIAGLAGLVALCANAGTLAIVSADNAVNVTAAQNALLATHRFDTVDLFDAYGSSPLPGSLDSYDAVLAYSNRQLWDPSGLGDVLAAYYNLGGKHLTVATYAFSGGPLQIGGALAGDYVGLAYNGTGDVSGSLIATVPTDPIFANINLADITFYHNINFAHPSLAPGATLLATDGAGVAMIARSANGVIDVNIYPGDANQAAFDLLANTLTTPEPGSAALVTAALLIGAAILRSNRRASAPAGRISV